MSEDSGSRAPAVTGGSAGRGGTGEGRAKAFRRAALGVLLFAFPVLLFGAFVRASLSGDGCGVNWPFCGPAILPDTSQLKSLIEFGHRVSSSVLFMGAVLGLYAWSIFLFPKGHFNRRSAGFALLFTLVSGLIGAVLVKWSLVVFDKSVARAVVMSLHLCNNYFLLASLLGACLPESIYSGFRARGGGGLGALLWSSAAGMFVLAVTGAVSAMGKTAWAMELAAARTVADRLSMHVGEEAPAILKGGAIHPLIATSVMILVLFACRYAVREKGGEQVESWAQAVTWGFVAQMAIGVINLAMSAPIWLQLLHLALALATWISLMMLIVVSLQVSRETVTDAFAAPIEAKPSLSFMSTVKNYIALTKPRVISLLLFTTLAAMVIAQGGWPNWWLMLAVAVGGYMAAGAANTFNMVVERDLDVAMERTASRPTVTQSITNGQALIFATLMALGSFVLLTAAANLLTAMMAMSGLVFYVLIYTLLLKRRTWQNIVIGGAAGAFPPLVGYAAIKNELTPVAWILFAIIFFWTPVHFWALAILIKDDYAKAGVPMLPVVKGDRATVIQIVCYALLTAVISVVPVFLGLGLIYIIGAAILNLALVAQSVSLMLHTDRPHALALFKYSMVYLALMFVVIAVDRSWGVA